MNCIIVILCYQIFFKLVSSQHGFEADSNKFVVEANYAVDELKKLSDSGIYQSLELTKILSAFQEEGLYHHNTIFQLELSSPYFSDGKMSSVFNVVVMERKDNGLKNIAIDEFPRMDEEAIEEFSIQKIESKRTVREESLRRIEIEAILLGENPSYVSEETMALKQRIDNQDVVNLLRELDSAAAIKFRQEESKLLQRRINNSIILEEELQLANFSLDKLYLISVGNHVGSDYQKYRAQQLVDNTMLFFQQKYHMKTQSL